MFRQSLSLKTFINLRKCSTNNKVVSKRIEDNALIQQVNETKKITKDDLNLRKPWTSTDAKAYSVLRMFYTQDNKVETVKFMSSLLDFSPLGIKRWLKERKEFKKIAMQSYLPERNEMLGNELAAAHFIVYRGGAVKFHNDDKWIKADNDMEYTLPRHYDGTKFLQGIDCADVELFYEGLDNFRNLHQLEWFSVNGCEPIDDWCLDTIGNIFSHSLIYLDIRNCPNISERGIEALQKLHNLKILYVDDVFYSKEFEMTCLLLEELNPDLDIRIE